MSFPTHIGSNSGLERGTEVISVSGLEHCSIRTPKLQKSPGELLGPINHKPLLVGDVSIYLPIYLSIYLSIYIPTSRPICPTRVPSSIYPSSVANSAVDSLGRLLEATIDDPISIPKTYEEPGSGISGFPWCSFSRSCGFQRLHSHTPRQGSWYDDGTLANSAKKRRSIHRHNSTLIKRGCPP